MTTLLRAVTDKLPDWFVQTSVGKAVVEEARQMEFTERQSVFERLLASRRELPKVSGKHDKLIEPLVAKVAAARRQLQEDERALHAAEQAKRVAVGAVEFRIRQDEALLAHSADNDALEAARRSIQDRFHAGRSTMRRWNEIRLPGLRDDQGRQAVRVVRNDAAINRLIEAQRLAFIALQELRFKNPENLRAAIAAIVAAVDAAWDRIAEMDDEAALAGGGPQRAA